MSGKHMEKTQKKRNSQAETGQSSPDASRKAIAETPSVNAEHDKLLAWFQTVGFRKKLFGGIDEVYLWRKLEELNRLYESALTAERARYDALREMYREKGVEQ